MSTKVEEQQLENNIKENISIHEEEEDHAEKYKSSPEPTHEKRPSNPRISTSTSVISTDDEEYQEDRVLMDDGIPPMDIPLEVLAGPALILPTNDLDGHTLNGDEFDWNGIDDDDDDQAENEKEKKGGALSQSGVFICLSKNSSNIAWFCIILFSLIFIAIDIAIFMVYRDHISLTSYSLELWFTWLAFMWCIAFMSQIFVELVPWAIRKTVSFIRPQSIEVLRMRLSYYKALRPYIKLLVISAWNWGSWAFIKDHIPLPVIGQDDYGFNVYQSKPHYVDVFFSIWECAFFASLFLFIEKFILQLIVTSFHKKAYGDRIKENDRALRILDRLKKMKKKNPQEFLLKRIRRKNKPNNNNNSGTNTNVPSRSHSLDENNNENYAYGQPHYPPPAQNKPIINTNNDSAKTTVRFPTQNMDTLIAIPPLEDRMTNLDDEKQTIEQEPVEVVTPKVTSNPNLFNKLTKKMKRNSKNQTDMNPGNQDEPGPLTRENTWFSRNSQEEKSSGFFGATRDISGVPGKILKGGYNKFVSQSSGGSFVSQNQKNNLSTTSKQAKYLAKKVFTNLIGDSQRDTIVESDFYPFFKTTKEASYAFDLFDKDGNGDLTKSELRSGCIRIYRERKNLTRSMRDLSQATGKLDVILMIAFTVVWVIIVCGAFGVNVGTDLMPLWSAFVAASFIFGTSARDAFEAIIFVFVTHPFDAGDRVLIGSENWIVQNVGLLVTTFTKWDGSIVYAKNSVLTTQYIINVRRSGRTGETIEIQISFSTPSWKIRKLIDHMVEWSNQFPKLYTTNATSGTLQSFQNQNLIHLSFYFEHTQNWQNASGRWLRHNNFMWELKEACEHLEISYSLPSQPFSKVNDGNDAPPESYNMGDKSSYGLDGMVTRRRKPYEPEDEDGFKNRPIGAEGSGANHTGNNADPGATAASAATLMFATSM